MNRQEMIKEATLIETLWGDNSYEFTDYETVRKQFEPKLNPKTCYLGLRTVFEDLDLVDTVEDIPDANDWELVKTGYTYNQDNYLERDIVYMVYTSFESDKSVCFIQVHIGVDARAGFTDFFAFTMEGTYEEEIYEALSCNQEGYELLDIEVDGKRYWVSIRDAFDCWVSLSTEADNGDMVYLNDISLDLYNEEDAIESIRDAVKDAEWDD